MKINEPHWIVAPASGPRRWYAVELASILRAVMPGGGSAAWPGSAPHPGCRLRKPLLAMFCNVSTIILHAAELKQVLPQAARKYGRMILFAGVVSIGEATP